MHRIHYRVTPSNPAAHLFRVSCEITQPDAAGQIISMPAWIPGSYLIRDFAKHIVSIKALDNTGNQVRLQRLDKDSWRCAAGAGPITIEYEVYAWDTSVRAAQLDMEYGFFNGSSIFIRVHGQEYDACTVTLESVGDELCAQWKVATAMPSVELDAHGFGEYAVDNYEELIDHPVAMGEPNIGQFQAAGVRHEIALFGQHHADIERLCRDLAPLCEQHIYLFDRQAPMGYYLFLVRVTDKGYGGLEHRNSSALICSRDSLPTPAESKITEGYRQFLGLCSHEYFHTWNIKRIKPAVFTPYELQKESYTEMLWVFEGITSYYDDLALVRSGLIDVESYLQLLGQTITRLMRNKGRQRQTIAESSFYAWTKFYQQDENACNAIVSYYTKGALVALCLDLLLRKNSNGEKSLNDVMRLLWQRFGNAQQGVPETGFEALAAEVAGSDQQEAVSVFIDRAIRSTNELPLTELLAGVGVGLHLRVAESNSDKGGSKSSKNLASVELGAQLSDKHGMLAVKAVIEKSAAQLAGLSAGDAIVAVNGLRASVKRLQSELLQAKPGDTMHLHVFRLDELREISVSLLPAELTTCYLLLDENTSPEVDAARMGWLGSVV